MNSVLKSHKFGLTKRSNSPRVSVKTRGWVELQYKDLGAEFA